MEQSSALVREVAIGRVVLGDLLPMRGELRYHEGDPLSVSLRLETVRESVTWRCSRDLLLDSLDAWVGEGDLRAGPAWRGAARVVRLELGANRDAFEIPRRSLQHFLEESALMVPRGQETYGDELEELLRSLQEE